jgi:hypothetical protein
MDDLEPLVKEIRALREYLEKRDAERRKSIYEFFSMLMVGLAISLILYGLHGFGWF